MDNAPLSLAESEAIAAILIELGYSARATYRGDGYPWGYQVIVTGRHPRLSASGGRGGEDGGRFRYVITHAGQLPQALADLAAGHTGGDKALEEGI